MKIYNILLFFLKNTYFSKFNKNCKRDFLLKACKNKAMKDLVNVYLTTEILKFRLCVLRKRKLFKKVLLLSG